MASWELMQDLLTRGARVYLVGMVAFLLVRVDVLLVNAIMGATDAGWYSVATYVAEGLVLIPVVVGTNLLPRIVRERGTALSAAVFRNLALIYGLLCLASVPALAIAIPLVFGRDYAASLALYALLLPGVYALGMLNSLVVHYFVRGYPRVLLWTWVAALAGNVACNIGLLPLLGTETAPITSSVAYVGVLIAHVRSFARDAGGVAVLVPRPHELAGHVTAAFQRGA
jgi:O-antigen/teichoic acid export membrane protein